MIPFSIIFDDPAWPELAGDPSVRDGLIAGLAVLDHGMKSGRPSVAFRINFTDGEEGDKVVIAQTTARLFCTAARAIMAKYPDLFEGE